MNPIKLRRSDPIVKDLLSITFPEYTGRKITARATESVFVNSTMDGGTGSEWAVVNLDTMEVTEVPQVSPMTAHMSGPRSAEWNLAWGTASILPNKVYAEKYYFCGQLMGVTFHVHPETMAKSLEAK